MILKKIGLFFCFFLIQEIGSAAVDPFSSKRLVGGHRVEVENKDNDSTQKNIRKNVLCGIRQNFDAIFFCVDSQWIALSVLESRLNKKIKWVKFTSVAFGNDEYTIGDELRVHRPLK